MFGSNLHNTSTLPSGNDEHYFMVNMKNKKRFGKKNRTLSIDLKRVY